MQLPEFTAQQAQQLSTFLAAQPNAMTLAQSEGYLFAVICSPEPLDVHQWLGQIVANEHGLDEAILFSFMAFYHKISEAVFSHGYTLPPEFDKEFTSEWCSGFVTGSTAYVDKLLQQQLPHEYAQALSSAQASLSFFSLTEQDIAVKAQQHTIPQATLCTQQYELMHDFALGYAELIEVVALSSGLYTDEGWE